MIIDEELLKEDIIYPYQLNVLYFLPMQLYKNLTEKKDKEKNRDSISSSCQMT